MRKGREESIMAFVVAGVSGHTGQIVAETLLGQKRAVKVVVRDAAKGAPWKAKGADVAVADLGDAGALTQALKGAEGAYVLLPPTFTAPNFRAHQDRLSTAIADAARASRVPHVVFLSSIGAQLASGSGPIVGLHVAEETFRREKATAWTFLRAGYFMENLEASFATLPQGFIPSFLPASFGIDMIATVDIGKQAAALLVEAGKGTEVVQLGGPPISMNDVAAAISRITGKPMRVQEAPLDAVVPTFTGLGMPKDLAELYREMLDGFTAGRIGAEPGMRRIAGTTSIETFLRGALPK
jgi:uncharacterized protein YbjT (DUF2867 family)